MVFTPHTHGGVGLCHLYHEHGAQQVIILLWHLQAGTPLGKTLEVLIHNYQLWSGFRTHILEDTKLCPWILDHWLTYLRTFMHDHHLHIRYDLWTIKPLRNHDRYIMDDLLKYDISRHQLEKLNACHMYLQVTTLAEIMAQTGEALLPQVLTDHHCPTPKGLTNISNLLLQWPNSNLPSATCWQLWTRMLCIVTQDPPPGCDCKLNLATGLLITPTTASGTGDYTILHT